MKWVETAYDHGALAGTSHWTAILTVVTRTPSTADVLRRNPLGIYVDAIDWSRELEPSASPAQTAAAASPSTPQIPSSALSNLEIQP